MNPQLGTAARRPYSLPRSPVLAVELKSPRFSSYSRELNVLTSQLQHSLLPASAKSSLRSRVVLAHAVLRAATSYAASADDIRGAVSALHDFLEKAAVEVMEAAPSIGGCCDAEATAGLLSAAVRFSRFATSINHPAVSVSLAHDVVRSVDEAVFAALALVFQHREGSDGASLWAGGQGAENSSGADVAEKSVRWAVEALAWHAEASENAAMSNDAAGALLQRLGLFLAAVPPEVARRALYPPPPSTVRDDGESADAVSRTSNWRLGELRAIAAVLQQCADATYPVDAAARAALLCGIEDSLTIAPSPDERVLAQTPTTLGALRSLPSDLSIPRSVGPISRYRPDEIVSMLRSFSAAGEPASQLLTSALDVVVPIDLPTDPVRPLSPELALQLLPELAWHACATNTGKPLSVSLRAHLVRLLAIISSSSEGLSASLVRSVVVTALSPGQSIRVIGCLTRLALACLRSCDETVAGDMDRALHLLDALWSEGGCAAQALSGAGADQSLTAQTTTSRDVALVSEFASATLNDVRSLAIDRLRRNSSDDAAGTERRVAALIQKLGGAMHVAVDLMQASSARDRLAGPASASPTGGLVESRHTSDRLLLAHVAAEAAAATVTADSKGPWSALAAFLEQESGAVGAAPRPSSDNAAVHAVALFTASARLSANARRACEADPVVSAQTHTSIALLSLAALRCCFADGAVLWSDRVHISRLVEAAAAAVTAQSNLRAIARLLPAPSTPQPRFRGKAGRGSRAEAEPASLVRLAAVAHSLCGDFAAAALSAATARALSGPAVAGTAYSGAPDAETLADDPLRMLAAVSSLPEGFPCLAPPPLVHLGAAGGLAAASVASRAAVSDWPPWLPATSQILRDLQTVADEGKGP